MIKKHLILSTTAMISCGAFGTQVCVDNFDRAKRCTVSVQQKEKLDSNKLVKPYSNSSYDNLARAIVRTIFAPQKQAMEPMELVKYYSNACKKYSKIDISNIRLPELNPKDLKILYDVGVCAINKISQGVEEINYFLSLQNRLRQASLHRIGSIFLRDDEVTQRAVLKVCNARGIDAIASEKLGRVVFFEGVAYALYSVSMNLEDNLLLRNQPNNSEIITLLNHTSWAIRYISRLEGKEFAPEASAQFIMELFDLICDLAV